MSNMPSTTAGDRKFLIFLLQGSLYALDLTQVAEVRDPPHLWPIPLAPAYYSGAVSFHGDIIAVLDLSLFLCLPGSAQAGKMIILDQEIASLAFLVDRVVRIVSGNEATVTSVAGGGFTAATLELPDGEALQLDLKVLVNEAELGVRKANNNKISLMQKNS